MNISLAAENLFQIGPILITNTVFTGFIVSFIILFFSLYMKKNLSYSNPGKFQLFFEMILDALYSMVEDVIDKKYVRKFFGFVFTFFIFILFSNWFGLTPFSQSISLEKHSEENVEGIHAVSYKDLLLQSVSASGASEEALQNERLEKSFNFGNCLKSQHCYLTSTGVKEFHETTHVFRAPTSDLSMAISFALISVVFTNLIGAYYLKFDYLKKYLNFNSFVDFFVGILEIVSEFGKLISFSFRLFGNIFAGEVLLAVITSISFGVATLPFFMLELFVGVIQAFVFFILTAVFLGLTTTKHH